MNIARLLPVAAALAPALSVAQTLFNVTERAGPGSTISLVGDSLSDSTRYAVTPIGSTGTRGTTQTLAASSTSGAVALLALPSTLATSMYEIVAKNGATSGNAVMVNRPRAEWLDAQAAMPGQIVRVSGRSFRPFNSATPKVYLVSSKNVVYPATVERGTDSMVRFRVGTTTPAGSYTVRVISALGTDANALPLTVLASRTDPLAVGTSWGADVSSAVYAVSDARLPAHPAGDGRTEDGAAIAADINWVLNHGGGTLLLDAKTYRIDKGDDWEVIRSGTVLRGAGMGKTILQLGYVSTPDYHCPLTFQGGNAAPEGLMDLTVQNLNVSGGANRVLNTYFGNPTKVFMKRVEFQMNNGYAIDLSHLRGVVIEGCVFNATSMYFPALGMGDVQDLRYVGNTDYHRAGRLRILYSDRAVIEGSTVQFDNNYRNGGTAETGALDVSFDQRTLLSNSDLGALGNPPNRGHVDGEVVLDQLAQTGDLMCTGMVGSASGNRILATQPIYNGVWADPNQPSPTGRMAVHIIAGKGAGQWRKATGWNAKIIDVDGAWTVTPDATSRFAVEPLLAYQQTIEGNRLKGGFSGIDFEFGGVDTTVEANTLTDTGGIFMIGFVIDAAGSNWGGAASNSTFNCGWYNAILDNSLTNSNGSARATISLPAFSNTGIDPGPLLLANDVRGNSMRGNGSDTAWSEYGVNDGVEVVAINRDGSNATQNSILMQGTVLQDNTMTNTSMPVRNWNVAAVGGLLDNSSSLGRA